jgi:hypothetical protein
VFQKSLKGDDDFPDAKDVDIYEVANLDKQEILVRKVIRVLGERLVKPRKLHILLVVIDVLEHLGLRRLASLSAVVFAGCLRLSGCFAVCEGWLRRLALLVGCFGLSLLYKIKASNQFFIIDRRY